MVVAAVAIVVAIAVATGQDADSWNPMG